MQRRQFAAGLVGALLLGGSVSRSQSAGKLEMIDFSTTAPGQLPAGFVIARTGKGAAAEWRVEGDASTASGRVLTQTSTDQTDYRFPLAILDKPLPADVEATVRFFAVAGRVDRAGGIAVRLIDADNYYVVRANALENNVNFYRVVKGSRVEIKGASVKVASGVWHTLGLKVVGDAFTITYDGKELFTAGDRVFSHPGRIALWTKADSLTRFDALSIKTK